MKEAPYISDAANCLIPTGLAEMDSISLMDRIETKYVVSLNMIPAIIGKLNGAYKILEINQTRVFDYHNVYLDTPEFHFFQQHVTGKYERYKVRFRKYVDTGTTFLEIKTKNNKQRTKKVRIESQLTEFNTLSFDANMFISERLKGRYPELNPVLINRFRRFTLAGLDSNERITVDYDLRYSDDTGSMARFPYIAVIEVKRDGRKVFSPVSRVIKDNRIHPCGFSKYCMGAAAMKDLAHKNNLKAKFLLLNRIENEYFRSIYA